jgi:hypothetical protein
MSTEQTAADAGTEQPPASEGAAPAAAEARDEVPVQVRVQIMATEHWSLLASRALAWNESFTRASMFLSTLSFSIVALALVGQASGFGEEFRLFALVVLPVVLFLGVATSLRMDSANHHDVQCVIGMNRIRAGYLELVPDLERFLVMGATDDVAGIAKTMAVLPDRSILVNFVGASPTLIAVLNAVLVAGIAGLIFMQVGMDATVAVVAGAAGFLLTLAVWGLLARNMLRHLVKEHEPKFPG